MKVIEIVGLVLIITGGTFHAETMEKL